MADRVPAPPRMNLRRALLWMVLCSPGLIPLLVPHLPFQDWPGHLGVLGALIHRGDPSANIEVYYTWKGWWGPNRLFYLLGFLLGQVFPPAFAAQLLLAICLGALGPMAAWLAKSSGAQLRAGLFAVPIALGRHIYCGFALNAAALVLLLGSLAAYFELREKKSLKAALLLLGMLLLLVMMHAFFYLVAFGLLLLVIAADLFTPARRGALLGLGALGLSGVGLVPQFTAIGARTGQGPSLFDAVWTATSNADRSGLKDTVWEWLFASYRYSRVDDWAQWIWGFLLFGAIALGVIVERRGYWSAARVRLLGIAIVTATMFVVLPSDIGPPLNWWGGNLRLPPIAALLLVPLAGPGLDWLGARAGAVVGAVMFGIVALAGADLLRFEHQEMDGFEEVLAAIPPGKKLAPLHYTPAAVHEYPGEPHGYVGDYYLLEKGGLVPENLFEVVDIPFARKVIIGAPAWGIAHAFSWDAHGAGADGFLVRILPGAPEAPFSRMWIGKVELVKAAGNWRYYQARAEPLHPP